MQSRPTEETVQRQAPSGSWKGLTAKQVVEQCAKYGPNVGISSEGECPHEGEVPLTDIQPPGAD